MPERPECHKLESTIKEVVSISALAKHYGVSFSTARKWLLECGLKPLLSSPEHLQALKEIISKAPITAIRRRIDQDLEHRLADEGDRKLLARAIVDEFTLMYTYKKNGRRKRYTLVLRIMMYDLPPVEQVARLIGAPVKQRSRKTKYGVAVPYWDARVEGYRAYKILQLVRPYLVGQKAFQADKALTGGPLSDVPVSTGKHIYKEGLMSAYGNTERKGAPAPLLPEPSQSSVT